VLVETCDAAFIEGFQPDQGFGQGFAGFGVVVGEAASESACLIRFRMPTVILVSEGLFVGGFGRFAGRIGPEWRGL
jgi:hypothetical protein